MVTSLGSSVAQAIAGFFHLAHSDHATEVIPLTPFPTHDPGYSSDTYPLNLSQAETVAGFKVKGISDLPANWVFHGAEYKPENQGVRLFYSRPSSEGSSADPNEDIYLYLSEQKGDFDNYDFGQCPNGTISEVKVNQWPGELADGAVWMTFDPPTPGAAINWICEKTDPGIAMILRWEETDLKYEIIISQFAKDHSTWLSPTELITLAENLK
jgi:hypothetical protein